MVLGRIQHPHPVWDFDSQLAHPTIQNRLNQSCLSPLPCLQQLLESGPAPTPSLQVEGRDLIQHPHSRLECRIVRGPRYLLRLEVRLHGDILLCTQRTDQGQPQDTEQCCLHASDSSSLHLCDPVEPSSLECCAQTERQTVHVSARDTAKPPIY